MNNIIEITQEEFEERVLNSPIPVLVDFYAPWCNPCKRLGPTIDELAVKYQGIARVYKINVDNAIDIADRYNIQSIPAIRVFKSGEVTIEKQSNFLNLDTLSEMIEESLK